MKTSCLPVMGCFIASSHALLGALFTDSNVPFSCDVMLMGTSNLSNL